MRRLALSVVALGSLSSVHAQTPPPLEFSYQWSASGKEYVMANRVLYRDWLDVDRLTFDGVAGFEVNDTKALTFGFGVSYEFDLHPVYARIGLFAVTPTESFFDVNDFYKKFDFGVGITVGVRF